jgi:predicted dehydrogenase
MKPVGFGLVGLGRWGINYLRTLTQLPESRLVAAADADAATRARVAAETGIAVFESAEELLSCPAVRAAVIATPDRTHYALAAAALTAGRDVLVEKPLALEPAEAEALVEQSETRGLVLAVGHTAVYQPGFAALLAETRTKTVDAARQAWAIRTSSGYADGRSHPVLDLCPHDIALAVLLFGTPVAARGSSKGSVVEYEVRFQRGALLAGRAEWCKPPHVRRFEVAGAGTAILDSGNSGVCCDIRETPLGRQCLDFADCCRTRRQPLSNGRVGLAVVRCVSALAASCADGNTWVPLPLELRRPNAESRQPRGAAVMTPGMELQASESRVPA